MNGIREDIIRYVILPCTLFAEDAEHMGVRFRLYGCERMRRERMIGESIVGFASINLDTPTTHMLTLEPRSNLSVSIYFHHVSNFCI